MLKLKKVVKQVKTRGDYHWRKLYRTWLFWIGIGGGLAIWHWSNLNNALLFVTAVVVFWYTRETFDLKQISTKQLKETRKQTDMQLTPYLRLQWDNGSNRDIYDIVNEGEGLALDVVFEPMRFIDQNIKSTYQIKSRPLIAKSKPTVVTIDELNSDDNVVKGTGIKGYLEACIARNHFIKASYKDIEGRKYKVVFQADSTYNDRFKIVEQGRA